MTSRAAAERIGEAYQRRLTRGERRAGGAHYTPRRLTEPLVRAALEPLVGRLPAGDLRVCDPACGCGAFLLQACRYLADRLAETTGGDTAEARRMVAERCLFGLDKDPRAVELTKRSLERLAGSRLSLEHNIRQGDALLTFDWAEAMRGGGFDAVLTNPPFINAIDGDTPAADKARLRERYPLLSGAADLAYYFVALAHELGRDGATAGLVLPRAFLNAPAARRLRAELLARRPPSRIWLPDGAKLFDAANVRVAAVVLGGGDGVVRSENWWQPFAPTLSERERQANGLASSFAGRSRSDDTSSLGERFEVIASMTAAMAYDLLPFLADAAEGDAPRLITTGLIDPEACLWGEARCRYLKRVFAHPRIVAHPTMPPALRRRLELTARPKVLVAGVAGPGDRVEAFLDRDGSCRGAVSTFTVFDPTDDLARLERLCRFLNGDTVAGHLAEQLGASAMGSGLLTITKDFLRRLPLPAPGTLAS